MQGKLIIWNASTNCSIDISINGLLRRKLIIWDGSINKLVGMANTIIIKWLTQCKACDTL